MTAPMKKTVYPVPSRLSNDKYPKPHYDSFGKYKEEHIYSITKPEEFWSKVKLLTHLYYAVLMYVINL
jgi:acetyl-CoA synthetase